MSSFDIFRSDVFWWVFCVVPLSANPKQRPNQSGNQEQQFNTKNLYEAFNKKIVLC